MDDYRELKDRLKALGDRSRIVTIWQGKVNSVSGMVCEVQIGSIAVPGVRLKASELESENVMVVVPKVGTAVTIGSLSGDLSQLVVLKVDEAESVIVNGGKLGGLINIDVLTQKINELISTFNSHTHVCPNGATGVPVNGAQMLSKGDYEDEKVKH